MILGILILSSFFSFTAYSAEDVLSDLKQCLGRLEKVDRYYTARIPTVILALDRRLIRMRERVVYRRRNLRILERQLEKDEATKLDEMMAGNAAVSCREDLIQYQRQLKSLYYFMLSAFATLILLAGYLIAGRGRPLSRMVEDKPHDKVLGSG